ncbi:hypothetical protein FBU30_000985 [Linnemannia zychae]|nr:hypothetical protein FBU30_000985 [Linnemannia zychae]
MSSSTPTVKDLYKVVTADLAAFIAQDRSKEHEPTHPRDTIQAYLDRFIKANNSSSASTTHHSGNHLFGSTTSTPLSSSVHPSTAISGTGNVSAVGHGAATSGSLTSGIPSTTITSGAPGSTIAAGQRHANELWYQTLTNNLQTQSSNNLSLAFHRFNQSSSPTSSVPSSQTVSTTGSPIIGSGGTSLGTGQAASAFNTASNVNQTSSPSIQSTGFSSSTANTSLAAQRFSAHLVTLYTQHGMDKTPIALIASRMIVYLTHLLPFLTPQLIILDWWDRLIEPAFQGEIKLEKDSLKACRDLVTECMTRDPLFDHNGSGTGSWLIAGDEEGQLDNSLAMSAMPIPQFVLRKYIQASHKLNHRLDDIDQPEVSGGWWANAKIGSNLASSGYAGHGSTNTRAFAGAFSTSSASFSSSATSGSYPKTDYPPVQQDQENQQKLFNRARAIIRRKKDILVKNLETILVAYGGNVGRVKDFFSCLYTYFVGAKYRAEVLGLLCQFIRRQRIHLHQILSTPLFDSLLLSLKQLMAVAYQEGSNLTGQTLKSFDEFDESNVSSRSNRTNKKSPNADENAGETASSPDDLEYEDISLPGYGIRWRRYGPALPGGTSEGAPDPTAIFSFIYGMYPCNLLKFLQSPRSYLAEYASPNGSPKQPSSIGMPPREGESFIQNPDEGILSPKENSTSKTVYIDEDLLKSRVQSLLKRHSLHPELLTLTCEQELSNKTRWQKLEPMEIVAMCVGLDVWSAGGLYGMGPVLRSIEEDPRSTANQDSDDNDNDLDATALKRERISDSSSITGSHNREASVQSLARTSVESLASEESEGTPIEILAQEDFFGPRLVSKDNPIRPLNSVSSSNLMRGPNQPFTRARTTSKDVKMSQILKNYATLRGIGQEDYLNEIAQNKSLGVGLVQQERRGSSQQSSAVWPPLATAASSVLETTVSDGAVGSASEESSDMATPTDNRRESISQTANVPALLQMNKEYREMIVRLERDLLMAKNELNFELFLKQQHIQQISKVHRAHVLDASVEAERQNLYNTCRSLKAQLHETRLRLEKEKSEMERRKNKQTHWDTELKNKVQTFREERKQLRFEVERLKQDIKDTRQSQEIQERLLTEERKSTFQLKNSIEDLSPKLKRMEEYEKRIEEMARQLVIWENEQSKNQEIQHQLEAVISRWQSLELLLAAEKEESRILRNRVSQQSQIMDDLQIHIAMMEGRVPRLYDNPSTELQSVHENVSEDVRARSEQNGVSDSINEEVLKGVSLRQKMLMSIDHQNFSGTSIDVGWPSGFNRSNSSQNGFDQQRRTDAMQEFMAKEKKRWDYELKQVQNKWSQEALRNQELEERILELQGQIELAHAINRRQHLGFGHQGGHPEDESSGSGNITGNETGQEENNGGVAVMNMPSKPQDVPRMTPIRMQMHDQFADVDTDDGGAGSSEMIGRYSHRQQESTEEDDDNPKMRQRRSLIAFGGDTSVASINPSRSKGKITKPKTKSKWLLQQQQQQQQPHERSQSARSSNTHLGTTSPLSFLDLSRSPNPTTLLHPRTSTESSSTSSSVAARAASGGLFPPTMYTRHMSQTSDGCLSDVTTASDSSVAATGTRQTTESNTEDVDGNGEGGSGSGNGSDPSGKKSNKNKTQRDRERDKIRLMSGMGPLVDPSKMYRNVRMI